MKNATTRIRFWTDHLAAAHYRVSQLAQLSGRSPRQLERDFQRILGCPPKAWIRQERMRRAEAGLASGQTPKALAAELQCQQLSDLCHLIKAGSGMPLRQFRAAHSTPPARHPKHPLQS